jgi:hypothetical protein
MAGTAHCVYTVMSDTSGVNIMYAWYNIWHMSYAGLRSIVHSMPYAGLLELRSRGMLGICSKFADVQSAPPNFGHNLLMHGNIKALYLPYCH